MKKNQPKKSKPKEHIKKNRKEFNSSGIPSWASYGIVILLGIIIYSNSFNCSFHLDDARSIVDNLYIRNLSHLKSLWESEHTRIIPNITFALNYHFGGLHVTGYHLVNLFIHLANSCLAYWLTLLIFSSPVMKGHPVSANKKLIAFFTTLFFVSHPLATESVTYIVQRINVMAAMFYMLSLALYLKARMTDQKNITTYLLYACSIVSAVLAMFSKENAFTLPIAIFMIEIFFLQTGRLLDKLRSYRTLVFIGLTLVLAMLLLNHYSFSIFKPLPANDLNSAVRLTPLIYLMTQFSVIVKYIQLLILPIHQNLDYDYPLSKHFMETGTLISFFVLVALLILSVYMFRKNRIISFGILWFFITLSIESSIIPIGDLIFEHRTYLPSFGYFLILSTGIYFLLQKVNKSAGIVVVVVIVLINSFLTFERNKVWKDELSLWSNVVLGSPNKGRAYNNRGRAFMDLKKTDEAFSDFNKAIQLRSKYAVAYYNRGNVYEAENKLQEAFDDYNKSISLDSSYAPAYNNRGNVFKKEQKYDEALVDYSKAIKINPNYYNAYNNRGTIYIGQNKYDQAISDLNKAIELKPDLAEAYANRGIAKLNSGDKEDSCLDFKTALDLGFQPVVELYNKNCR
jgi:Flp pilus assembly protein TadD